MPKKRRWQSDARRLRALSRGANAGDPFPARADEVI